MTPRVLLVLIALLAIAGIASMVTGWALLAVLALGCAVACGAFYIGVGEDKP